MDCSFNIILTLSCFSCPDVNDRAAILARGFDPLLANLLYAYGTALLYTYKMNTGMFGDKTEAQVEKQAQAMEGANLSDAEALVQSLVEGAASEMLQAMQAEEWGEEEGEEGEEGAEGEEDGEEGDEDVEEINADAEADRQVSNGDGADQKDGEQEEEEEKPKKAANGSEKGENGSANAEASAEAEGGENANVENNNNEGGEPELNDLELAWQVLEIARVVYATQPDRKLELSDVHFYLGNVAFEDDKQAEAKVEFEKALKYAEEANNRRAQAQVLLLLSNISELTNVETAVAELERAKTLMKEEIDALKAAQQSEANPTVDLKVLEDSIADIDSRIFALNEKFVPVNPDDVKDLPDPSKGKVTFSFSAPTIASGSGPAELEGTSDAPVNVLQPKKKAKPATESTTSDAPVITETVLQAVVVEDDLAEGRGQKRNALEIEVAEEIYTEEPAAKRAKVAEE